MELTSVRFEAFKSLYDVTCDLDHFTVITGPNGSGKSNFVDALNFLGEVYADGLEFAVGRAGGYDNIAHRRSRRAKRNVGISVEVRIDADDIRAGLRYGVIPDVAEVPADAQLIYRHGFQLGTTNEKLLSDFKVKRDIVELRDADGHVLVSLTQDPERHILVTHSAKRVKEHPWLSSLVQPFDDPRFLKFIGNRRVPPTGLVLDQTFYYGNVFQLVRNALSGIKVFQLSPYQCRTSGVPTPNASLERHGENLPGAADHLRRNEPRAWAQVVDAMRTIMPGLRSIEVVYTEDRRLALQFREQGVGRPWNTNEVSDGTVQALALFIALFDTRAPVLAIEEPENSVHPWILRQFVDLCRDASAKQIVVTTHSPVLLNYVPAETVRLMAMSYGRSYIQTLLGAAESLRTSVMEGALSLFDAYDSGIVRDAVPRGFTSLGDDEDDL